MSEVNTESSYSGLVCPEGTVWNSPNSFLLEEGGSVKNREMVLNKRKYCV